ncbi:MAG: ATP-binding cassette domain-containing protein, partial [Roseobacter sp.]|nr:ATP-binding cassette domain-containing protein [Roseobacter sp.]
MTRPKTSRAVPPGAAFALRVHGVTKTFGKAVILQNADFDLRRGEVHALLGENGAGKSTLMNILTGIYTADAGTIEVDGLPVRIQSPAAAQKLGIGMVHQHFKLVMPFTGRENIRLAAGAMANWAETDARISDVVKRIDLNAELDVPVSHLSIAERQRIEILKALTLGARILILDEPTAVLTDQEAEKLLALMRDLAASDHAIVFITHKLREVMAAGDRVSTLRRGKMVMHGDQVADVTSTDLSTAMIGGQDISMIKRGPVTLGAPLLQAKNLTATEGDVTVIDDVSLTVHEGEIIGLAGVGGNGQRELAEVLLGLRACRGAIILGSEDIGPTTVAARRASGLRYVPADRSSDALCPNNSLADNLSATVVRTGKLGRGFISPKRIAEHAKGLIAAFAIAGDTAGGRRPVRLLSGGNAQKAVLARELDDQARLIIAHSPTRGLDVAA